MTTEPRRITRDEANALRKPFDPKQIGKLPKGGTQLSYVGHAATTDRLLAVDPEWTWEPVAFDENGLPAFTTGKGLWIRLTVCGVTRYGFGDGSSVKECIGDAIRNAAMRFGVALDLWGKEELEQAHEPAKPVQAPALTAAAFTSTAETFVAIQAEQQRAEAVAADEWPNDLTESTRKRMFAVFNKHGITDRDEQIKGIVGVIGRPIESRSELTEDEARAVCIDIETFIAMKSGEQA